VLSAFLDHKLIYVHVVQLGLFAHPIFSYEGDYPEVVKVRVGQKSKEEGFRYSRLPPFSLKEIEYIKGKSLCLYCRKYDVKARMVK
jgi:hypothetical protein